MEDAQLGDVGGVNIDLRNQCFNVRHYVLGRADHKRIGSFIGDGSNLAVLSGAACAAAVTTSGATSAPTATTASTGKATTSAAEAVEEISSGAVLVIRLNGREQIFDCIGEFLGVGVLQGKDLDAGDTWKRDPGPE